MKDIPTHMKILLFFFHPLRGSSLRNLFYLYKHNKVCLRYLHRAVYIFLRVLFFTPVRILESKIYNKKICSTKLNKPPVFVLGHWRSGTTLLHYMLSLDSQFCYLTTEQTLSPHEYILLGKPLLPIYDKIFTLKRPLDDMLMAPGFPEEDEFALANTTHLSPYHMFTFPLNYNKFSNYLTFSNTTQKEINQWKNHLINLYRKTVFLNEGCTVLSKNPPFTGKIKYLLELFPDAKFIHIYRNPYTVFLSYAKVMKMSFQLSLQQILSDTIFEEIVFDNYRILMQAFFDQKALIPKGNFVEIKFEEFECSAMKELEKIYSTLDLGDFSNVKDKFQIYLDSLKNYKKNTHEISPELTDKIYSQWAFTIDKWGYSPEK